MSEIGGINKDVVLAAARFLKELHKYYGEERALEMWDGIRTHVDKDIANAVLLGRLSDSLHSRIKITERGTQIIKLIKNIRNLVGCGLKEAKDMAEGNAVISVDIDFHTDLVVMLDSLYEDGVRYTRI